MSKAYVDGLLNEFVKQGRLSKEDATVLVTHLEKTGKINTINPMRKEAWVGAALTAGKALIRPAMGAVKNFATKTVPGMLKRTPALAQQTLPGISDPNIAQRAMSGAKNFATQTVPNAARNFAQHPWQGTKDIAKGVWNNPVGQGAAMAGGWEGASRLMAPKAVPEAMEEGMKIAQFNKVKQALTKSAALPYGKIGKVVKDQGLNLLGYSLASVPLSQIGKPKVNPGIGTSGTSTGVR